MHLLRQPDNTDHQAECLSAELCAAGATNVAPTWVQLLPVASGSLSAGDGRKWVVKDLASIIAAIKAKHPGGICLDINHGTDLAAKQGHEAPAAAWITEYAAHGPNNEPGLWGKPQWTPRGKKTVEDGDYRFLSPVVISRKSDGLVVRIDRCTLTNDPALTLKSLFHNTTTENEDVKLSKELCAALGIAEGSDDAAGITAATALKASASHVALLAEAGGIAKGAAITDDVVTGLCTKLKAPVAAGENPLQATVDKLQKDLASLQGTQAKTTAEAKVGDAIKAGKIVPAQKDWAVDYCTRDPKGFDEFVGKQPVLLSDDTVTPNVPATGPLSTEEKAICAQMGLTEDEFRADGAVKKKDA